MMLQIDNIKADATTHDRIKLIYGFAMVSGGGKFTTIHLYETGENRDNGIKYFKRKYKVSDSIFLEFEIPLGIYLESARKSI
jgi:hypothetical protein